jgi:acyl-CoA thioesterase-2
VELRPLDARRHLLVDPGPPLSRFWIRALSDAPAADLPAAPLVAYLSDYLAANSVLAGHVHELPAESLFVASLNHSLWLHAPADPADWLYYEFESPWAGGGRALCTGRIFSRQGQLLASVAQAVMLRPRRAQDLPLPVAGESLVL